MAIKFKNLTKRFGEQKVLEGIDLEIADGQTTVIVGSSGSGKSTMLRCINLLEIPEEGELELDGEDKIRRQNFAKRATAFSQANGNGISGISSVSASNGFTKRDRRADAGTWP